MRKNKIICIVVVIMFIFTVWGMNKDNNITINNKQLTEKEKLDDFEYMYTVLKENYPYFEVNKRLNGVDWLAKKDDYINKIKATSNDKSFFNTLSSILLDLNNGHTDMLDKNNYFYSKSIYENNSEREAWSSQLNNFKTIERYSYIREKENLKSSSENVKFNNVKTMDLKEGSIAYLAIHSLNTFNIDEDMEIIKPYLEQIKDYNDLIIDIRGNGGGDDRYWSDNIVPMLINKPVEEKKYSAYRGGTFIEPFLKNIIGGYEKLEPISNIYNENLKNLPPELKEEFKYYSKDINNHETKNSVGFKGKIYLLVDKQVFSASEAFAVFAKNTGFATLVGEKTGGDGIGSDPVVCSLPNSGYVFRFTKEMGLVSDGSCNFERKTEPDIEVLARINEDISKDQAIQAVLNISQ